MFVVAFRLMHDIGFTPEKGSRPLAEMRKITSASIEYGWKVPAVKWLMVEALFTGGVGIYAFYALQPYLLELYGDPQAYTIAGLDGVDRRRRADRRRDRRAADPPVVPPPHLGPDRDPGDKRGRARAIGFVENFYAVIGLIVVWGLLFAATMPIRQAYINGMIPSRQRATILSFDSLMSSTGGVWAQPLLGRAADVYGYATSYLISAGISALAIPCLLLSRRQGNPADTVQPLDAQPVPEAA